jgi:hypothetical protein
MTKSACLPATILLSLTLGLPGKARADRRIFAFTYPHMTLPQGTLELEHYLDLGLNNWDNPATPEVERDWSRPSWRHMIELEYGITDRLDFGFYNVFSQAPYGTLRFDGIMARSRYRFADPGVHAVDTAIYGEVIYFGDEIELEQKVILSKILGRVEIAFNGTIEEGFEIEDKEWEFTLAPSLGIGYHVAPILAFGVEYQGRLKMEVEEVKYFAHYFGPALSVASGPFYWTLGAQWQLGKRSDMPSIQVRSLLGITL